MNRPRRGAVHQALYHVQKAMLFLEDAVDEAEADDEDVTLLDKAHDALDRVAAAIERFGANG